MLTIARQKFFNRYLPMFLSVVLIVAGAFVYLAFNNPQQAQAAISHVQTFKVSGAGVSSVTTASTATTAGDDLVAFCVGATSGTAGATPTISDGVNTWSSKDISNNDSGSAGKTTEAIFHAHNIAGGSIAVKCQFGGSEAFGVVLFVSEFSGVDTSQADGVGLQGIGTGTLADSGSFSTTNSSDLIVGFTETDFGSAGSTMTQGTNWTLPTNGSQTDGSASWVSGVEYRTNVAANSYNATFNISSADWSSTIFAYKATAAGGGGGAPEGERARGGTKARGGVRFR